MAKNSMSSWQAPPQASSENYKLGWLNEHAEDGQAWQKSQRGYGDWFKAFEIISGRDSLAGIPEYRSRMQTGRLKRNLKEVRGAVCNIRPIWGYTSDNAAFQSQAQMMNEATISIYGEVFLDLSIKKCFDWAATTCIGWAHPGYRRDMAGRGKGNLFIDAFGMPCILPTQLPSDGDWQKAYAVSLMDEMPIYMAHGLFPKFQHKLFPTSSRFWYSSEIRTAAKGNLMQRMFGNFFRGSDSILADAYVPIRKTWVTDLSINETGEIMYMGDWDISPHSMEPVPMSSWSYLVHPYGKPMGTGGKKADENDAKIYPSRRLIISSEACVMYDGPAFDWHGELPLIPLCLDDWAFEPMGYSIVRDGYDIQKSLNELERGTMDKNRAQLDMSLAYDINSVNPREAMQYDPMQPRSRVGFDGSLVDEPFKSPVPAEVLRITPEIFQAIEHLENTMDHQMGVKDLMALARARGVLTAEDSMDKLAEANGPVVMDITRNVERFLSKIGNQTKYIIPQFYPTRRIMQYVGPDKVTPHTMDFDPERLIPSHLPDEIGWDKDNKPQASKYTMLQRAKWFCDNLRFSIAPHTAHELVQMAQKLGLIQLRKAGLAISGKTIAQAWNIYNYGGPDGNTEYDRYYAEMEDAATHAMRLKKLVAAIEEAGMEATPALVAAIAQTSGQNSKEGRPATGLEAPRVVAKDGGTRSTISQSGS